MGKFKGPDWARNIGGAVSANKQRKEAIRKYYENPNICFNCLKTIEVGSNKVKNVRQKKFCNNSCSASFNNKYRKVNKWAKKKLCKYCEKETPTKDSTTCVDYNPNKIDWTVITIKELKERYNSKPKFYFQGRIRLLSRNVYKNSGLPNYCVNCKYELQYDVCHIKSIKDFSEEARISEVNNINNLIALCKRCHWEFDNGYLKLEKITGRVSED